MKTKYFLYFFYFILLLSSCTKVEPDPVIKSCDILPDLTIAEGNSANAKMVNRCIEVWRNMKRTKYVHNSGKVIDETNGIYMFDCSGFAGEIIINKSLTDHYLDLMNNRRKVLDIDSTLYTPSRPLASNMYDYFRKDILKNNTTSTNDYWKVFMSIDSLKRGDLIVARFDDQWRIEAQDGNTGHVMIAWEINSVNNHNDVVLQILDATSSPHSNDTRYCDFPVAEKNSGIGFGSMIFKISTNGHRRPYAFKWRLNSKYYYNLTQGNKKNNYNRLEGIIFARPI